MLHFRIVIFFPARSVGSTFNKLHIVTVLVSLEHVPTLLVEKFSCFFSSNVSAKFTSLIPYVSYPSAI